MKSIHQVYTVNASKEKVWDALVNPKIIEKWGGGPAIMDEKTGTEFSLWGGEIHGKNTKVVLEKLLVQDWFGGKWDKPSVATFTLSEKEGLTTIDFLQEQVPDTEYDDLEDGWKTFYLGPLKDFLEGK
ncbi:MAG: SRPBCC domain-containing protein [Candidatus Levyibacteriota bacterium]